MNDTAPRELSISWSALRTHEDCPQKAFLVRSGKRGPGMNLRNFFHGMVVDRLMRIWLTDPNRRAGDMAAAVEEAIDATASEAKDDGAGVVRWRNSTDRDELTDFCKTLVDKLEPILTQHVLPYQFHVGYRFKVPARLPYLDGTPARIFLHGEMDLFVEQAPGSYAIWDLKGTADPQYFRKVLGQLLFYDLACYAQTGTPAVCTGLIQPMCPEPVLTAGFSQDDRTAMWARITAMAQAIWSDDHACKATTDGCTWCEVKHACPRYAPTPGTNTVSLAPPAGAAA